MFNLLSLYVINNTMRVLFQQLDPVVIKSPLNIIIINYSFRLDDDGYVNSLDDK